MQTDKKAGTTHNTEQHSTVWLFHEVGQHPCHADAMLYHVPTPYSQAVADIMTYHPSAVVLLNK